MSMNTSWRMRWEGQLASMGQMRILVRNSEDKRSLEDLNVDGIIIIIIIIIIIYAVNKYGGIV